MTRGLRPHEAVPDCPYASAAAAGVRVRLRLLAATAAFLVSGCSAAQGAQVSPSPSPSASVSLLPSAGHPCGAMVSPPARYQHVVLIVMENRSYNQIVGSPAAPYLNQLAGWCGLATNYAAVTHPSLPNYIALTSGSTQGIVDDGPPAEHRLGVPSLFSLLGSHWRSLEESMPGNCVQSGSGEYAVKHNPAAYYVNIRAACSSQDVPLTSPPDISARFTFITPNLCSDMHDCATSAGDAWLANEVPQLVATPEYRSGLTVIFITWDEGTGSSQRVATFVIAPSVPHGARSSRAFTHYSLLRTIEQLLGLEPLLGGAARATTMASTFNL